MRRLSGIVLTGVLLYAASIALAQRQGGRPAPADDLVIRMMAFDADKDGKLTKSEVTDDRLHRLFDRADADKDGTVTKEELTALAAKEPPTEGGGPGGFGPPLGGGPGGFMGGPPRPGEVLPSFLQQRLKLTDEQKAKVADLQKDVDAQLDKILTDEQKTELKEMRRRGPGGFGPPPGGRRPGGRPGPDGGGPPPPPPQF